MSESGKALDQEHGQDQAGDDPSHVKIAGLEHLVDDVLDDIGHVGGGACNQQHADNRQRILLAVAFPVLAKHPAQYRLGRRVGGYLLQFFD